MSPLYGVLGVEQTRGRSSEPGRGLNEESGGDILEGTRGQYHRAQRRAQPRHSGGHLTDLRSGRSRRRQQEPKPQLTGGAATQSLLMGVRTSVFALSEWGPSQLRDRVLVGRGRGPMAPSTHRGHSQKPCTGGLGRSGNQEAVQRWRSSACFDRKANGRISVEKSWFCDLSCGRDEGTITRGGAAGCGATLYETIARPLRAQVWGPESSRRQTGDLDGSCVLEAGIG